VRSFQAPAVLFWFETEMEMGQWVKWVTIFKWVTWVTASDPLTHGEITAQ